MKEKYLRYYDQFSPIASAAFFWDSLFLKKPNERVSLLNRQRDYQKLLKNKDILEFHKRINAHLWKAKTNWSDHDYGEGYFYQSFHKLGISGLRYTEGRLKAMDLRKYTRGKRVLEIGCNTGFISIYLAEVAKYVYGFDLNPHLIDIAKETAKFLRTDNLDLECRSFENINITRKFDVVLSFANHSTYDENTKHSLEEYFDRCDYYLADGGLFLFESHPAEHDGKERTKIQELIENRFEIQEKKQLSYGEPLDRNRIYIIAKKGTKK